MQNQEIQIYEWKKHIRKRPCMYISNLRLTGFTQMLEYLFEEMLQDSLENPIFEIVFFHENRIIIKITNTDTKKFLLRLDDLRMTDDKITSLGLGVITSLSSDISIAVNDLLASAVFYGKKGHLEPETTASQGKEKNITIGYTIDREIFTDLEIIYDHVNDFLRQFAFLNPNLKIISIDKTTGESQRNIFYYPTGVFKQLDYIISQQPSGIPSVKIHIDAQINKYSYKIGISNPSVLLSKPFIKTYAGNIEMYMGGSFNDGILEGLILAIRKIAERENVDIKINKSLIKNEFTIIASVKGGEFNFEGSLRRKLGMPKLKKDVRQLVYEYMTNYFDSNSKAKENILDRFKRTSVAYFY